MDVETLARIQFAFTVMFHYIYPPLSIGLALFLVIIEGMYYKTKNFLYLEMAKFWTKVFALTFAIGVATGIVMEFEFGTNWATYSRFVGDVFGSALAAEGVFAFFLESGFLAIVLFGWNRVSIGFHWFSQMMVCLGAHFSAIWIIVANSWMQTPAGFHIVGEGTKARAEITDFWAMVFNPSSVDRLVHSVIGAWLAGAFLVISVSAYYLLKGRFKEFSKASIKVALIVASISLVLQLASGHSSAEGVAINQPAKLAAFEGLYKTQKGAPLYFFGLPNSELKEVQYGLAIPKALSYLAHGDFNAEVGGLDLIPREDWPKVEAVFQVYHLMIATWVFMVITVLFALYKYFRGTLESSRFVLSLLVISVLFPQIGNQSGWVSAEMGRYPWIVQGLLRISDGLSKTVVAEQVLGSLILFGFLYVALFAVFLFLLNEKIKAGPTLVEHPEPYHHLKDVMDGERDV